MKKSFCAILSILICVAGFTGCSKKPRLDLKNFEKYALADLKLEKKDVSANDPNAYYDLDFMVGENDTEECKRDHYAQVYSQPEGNIICSMVMVYTDYQSEEEARAFYTNITAQEMDMVTNSDRNYVYDQSDDYLLVACSQNSVNWQYDCLYIQKDVILYVTITIGTSDIMNINADWLNDTKQFFQDLRIKSPYPLTPEIESLTKPNKV